MERFEQELKGLKLAQPPGWLKARAMVAAQNQYALAMKRRRRLAAVAIAVAAVLMLAIAGTYLMGAFGLINRPGPASYQAGPAAPVPSPLESPQGDR